MESHDLKRHATESEMKITVTGRRKKMAMKRLKTHRTCIHYLNNRGAALVMTLILSLAGLAIATGLIYFLVQSVAMSGAGKRYTTASEAADGAIEVMKDAINLVIMGEPVSSLPIVDNSECLSDSILNEEKNCTISLALPGENLFTDWNAGITVTRLYSSPIPGSRIEFARAGGGAPATAVYFRINAVVMGPGSARAETTAFYRYTM